jgi:hypothetical protein
MNGVHKIAVFWRDVHILYVVEMAQYCMLLLKLSKNPIQKDSSLAGTFSSTIFSKDSC